jgi:hypothetical protein
MNSYLATFAGILIGVATDCLICQRLKFKVPYTALLVVSLPLSYPQLHHALNLTTGVATAAL